MFRTFARALGALAAALAAHAAAAQTTATTTFTVSIEIQNLCTVSAADIGFGTVAGSIGSNIDRTGTITVNCNAGVPYLVGIGSATREMAGPGGVVSYELYNESTRTTRWGTTLLGGAVAGVGSGANQGLTVYARVPSGQSVSAGTYSQTNTVTVTY